MSSPAHSLGMGSANIDSSIALPSCWREFDKVCHPKFAVVSAKVSVSEAQRADRDRRERASGAKEQHGPSFALRIRGVSCCPAGFVKCMAQAT